MVVATHDCGGLTDAHRAPRPPATGQCGHDGAAEGGGVSHGCPTVSERLTHIGASGQANGGAVTTKLYAPGTEGVCAAWPVCQGETIQAGPADATTPQGVSGPRVSGSAPETGGYAGVGYTLSGTIEPG